VQHRERLPVRVVAQRIRDPCADVARDHPPPDLLVRRSGAQPVLVLGLERLQRHGPALEARCETFEHD